MLWKRSATPRSGRAGEIVVVVAREASGDRLFRSVGLRRPVTLRPVYLDL